MKDSREVLIEDEFRKRVNQIKKSLESRSSEMLSKSGKCLEREIVTKLKVIPLVEVPLVICHWQKSLP